MRHGARIDPPNRFESTHREADWEHLADDPEYAEVQSDRPIDYLPDAAGSIVSENDSPDVPFRYSVNPYRGCAHGCAYCYARSTHEYLGYSAGLDFETKILVKRDAAELLRRFLARSAWRCEPITFSGVTDCYQPAERQFRLTRACLEVMLECRQPTTIVTKNALIVRDLDVLRPLAERRLVQVFISITTLDAELARTLEPRTSVPAARLRAVRALASAGVPVGAMVAPIVPGLNDFSLATMLAAARDAGAQAASYTLLRLPQNVALVFRDWLARNRPLAAAKIESLVRQTHGGNVSEAAWGRRMRGHGELAEHVGRTFKLFARRYGLDGRLSPLDCSQFRPPVDRSGQLALF